MSEHSTIILFKICISYIPFLFSLCFHEYAHGFMAKLKGDRTAELMGRLSMNPLAHVDWIGTVILPLSAIIFPAPIFFGWAKPVPVNERNLSNPIKDMFWIALAGPMANILLAIVGTSIIILSLKILHVVLPLKAMLDILKPFIRMNLFLAFFNLIPIHPLDGGKVVARFLPNHWNRFLEEHQGLMSWCLFLLVISGALRFLAIPVDATYSLLLDLAKGFLQ